jgi:hypothetical protein
LLSLTLLLVLKEHLEQQLELQLYLNVHHVLLEKYAHKLDYQLLIKIEMQDFIVQQDQFSLELLNQLVLQADVT